MDDQEYHLAADACLERVARWLGDVEELDVTASDGLVTVEFEDGTRFVLNRQSATHQMWLAAGAPARHYGWGRGGGSGGTDPRGPGAGGGGGRGGRGAARATPRSCSPASARWWRRSWAPRSRLRPEPPAAD